MALAHVDCRRRRCTMMPYLLLVYGAAFVAAGFALALQARATGDMQPLPRIAVGLLAGFALVHGASEWASMASAIEARIHGSAPEGLVVGGLVLLALSFALLFAFGSALLVRYEYRLVHVIAGGVVPLVLCALLVSRVVRASTTPEAGSKESIEAIVRYVLGIPACLSAALGLLTMRRSLPAEETRTLQHIGVAAGVFLCYGVLAGVVVPRAPFAPASVLNASAFEHNVRLPVEVLRAACAIAIVFLLSEAFIVEPFHRLLRELALVRGDVRRLLTSEIDEPLDSIERGARALAALPPAEHGSDQERAIERTIRDAADRVRERVSELVDVTDLESSELALTPAPIDLRPLLIRAADWQCARGNTAARVRIDCPDRLATVLADPSRVEQVLRKLLANACERASGNTEILVEAEAERDAVAVSVTTRGEPIAGYELPYVFARDDGDASDGGVAPRANLGLHLARGLVEAMGGTISVESVANAYVTFRFTLPLARNGSAGVTLARRTE